MSACIGTPISWLRLEQYALGELAAGRRDVAEHLAACAACRACFEKIEADAKTDLRPLPARAPVRRRAVVVSIVSGLALAAAAVLAIARVSPTNPTADDNRIKGDAIAFSLVRDDEALIAEAGGTFRDGDRFKVLVTCPPGARTKFDVVVYDDAGASFPLEPVPRLECGNDVPLPGAFRVTGTERVRVCLIYGDRAPDRGELARLGYESAAARGACKLLEPAP